MNFKVISGSKIKESIPTNLLDKVKLSFEDFGMNMETDLQFCELRTTEKGTCWIHDTRDKTPFWNGTLIATFRSDGESFYFTKNKERNTEVIKEYQNSRSEFFKVPRTAQELEKFESRFGG